MRRIIYPPSTIVKLPNIFGNGSDSNMVISGDITLSSDLHAINLTINAGVTITTNGWRIFVQNRLQNNGTIRHLAESGFGIGGGDAGNSNTVTRGAAGGDGLAGTVGNGGAAETITPTLENSSTAGDGGNAGAQTGGSSGPASGVPPTAKYIANIVNGTMLSYTGQSGVISLKGGRGGGGGANATATTANSGGGGAGGGVVYIAAKILDNKNGTISVAGGNGAAATGTGNAGGGGGGGGGLIILIYINHAPGTTNISGGSGGAGIGTGLAGNAGGNGLLVTIPGI